MNGLGAMGRRPRDRRRWVVFVAATVLPACTVDVSQKTRCRSVDDCVAGYVCVSSRCVSRDGGPGDVDAIGGSDGAASPPPAQTVLWLDATKGFSVTGDPPTAEWLDQSGNGNHARQGMPMSIPVFTAGAGAGLPAITFDGQGTFLTVDDAPSLRFGTGDYAVLLVARATNASAGRFPILFHKTESASPNRGPALYLHNDLGQPGGQIVAEDDVDDGATSTRPYNDGQLHLFVMRRAGTILGLRVDAATISEVSETPTVNVDAPGRALIIGDQGYDPPPGRQALEGDVAELIAIKGPLADEQLTALEAGLMNKYGLRPAPEPPPLSPSVPPGLVLWLDAGSGVASADGSFQWRDRSGLGNDAVAPQGAGIPQMVQAWPGLPAAVELSGDNQFLVLPPGMRDFTAGLSAFIVVEPQAPLVASPYTTTRFLDFASPPAESYGVVIERAGIEGSALEYVTCEMGNVCYHAGVAAEIVRSNARQLLEVHASGGDPGAANVVLYFENGVTAGYVYGRVPAVVNRQSTLIGRSNGGAGGTPDVPDLRGYLGEIVLYNRLLDEDERRGVERYLLDRWNLP